MAAEILAILMKTNLAAAAAILLALALRKPARTLFGARVAYALWLVVPLAVGACVLPPRTVVLPYAAPSEAAAATLTPSLATGAVATVTNAGPLIGETPLIVLWLSGAAISLGFLARSQSRFMRSLGGVVREGRFLRARAPAAGPAVVGAIFPRIVLPADFETRYGPAEQKVVLAHEAAHLASGDAAVNAATALARCLFWFNPLVHLAARVLRVDQEFACDAAVLRAYPHMRRPYAEAMLKTQLAATALPLGCYWPAGAANPLKERIAMLTLNAPSRHRRLCGGAGVLALCLSAGAAAWAAQPATVTVAAPPTATEFAATDTTRSSEQSAATVSEPDFMPAVPPSRVTGSSGGNTYQRADADPVPARLYVLRVTMPNGSPKTLISLQRPLLATTAARPEEVRAALALYARAKEEEAARAARGVAPQPLTPQLNAALRVMSDYERVTHARHAAAERARIAAEYDRITVTTSSGSTFSTGVPKKFTSEAKARALAHLDAEIDRTPAGHREGFVKARAVIAQMPTID